MLLNFTAVHEGYNIPYRSFLPWEIAWSIFLLWEGITYCGNHQHLGSVYCLCSVAQVSKYFFLNKSKYNLEVASNFLNYYKAWGTLLRVREHTKNPFLLAVAQSCFCPVCPLKIYPGSKLLSSLGEFGNYCPRPRSGFSKPFSQVQTQPTACLCPASNKLDSLWHFIIFISMATSPWFPASLWPTWKAFWGIPGSQNTLQVLPVMCLF